MKSIAAPRVGLAPILFLTTCLRLAALCFLGAVAARGQTLFFTTASGSAADDTLRRVEADGSGLTLLHNNNTVFIQPTGLAVDVVNQRIYVGDGTGGTAIRRFNLDGTGGATVISALPAAVLGVALDVANQRIYYVTASGTAALDTLGRVNFDGTGNVTLHSGNTIFFQPSALALDLVNQRIYIADGLGGTAIRRFNLDGSGGATVVSALPAPALGIALDVAGQRIYYTTASGTAALDTLGRVNYDGTGNVALHSGNTVFVQPVGLALDVGGAKIFVADGLGGSAIRRFNLDGSGGGTVISGLTAAAAGVAALVPPTVSNIGKSVNEDATLTFAAADFDAGFSDQGGLAMQTLRITSLPASGQLRLSGSTFTVPQDIARASIGTLTFVPTGNFSGATSFGWTGSNGTVFATSGAVANLTVNPINDAPVIVSQNPISTPEETGRTIIFADLIVNDVDNTYPTGFTLTVMNGANYTRSGNTITPALNYNGGLTVPVQVSDGALNSNTFNLSVIVTPVNDAPTITGQSAIAIAFNTSRTIALLDLTVTDVDNSYPGGFTLGVQNGSNYTRIGNSITPFPNFFGTLAVPVQVNDGSASSNILGLVVTVNPDPLFAQNATNIAPEPGGGYRVRFVGNPGQTYTIQDTATLQPVPIPWQFLGTRTADASGNYSIVDNPPPGTLMRFYRSIFP